MGTPADEPDRGNAEHGIVRARYDWSETLPSEAVVRTVAVVTDRGPLELTPLYDAVDPDALDECVRSLADARDPQAGVVTFRFDGRTVAVHGSGQVLAWPVGRRHRSPGDE